MLESLGEFTKSLTNLSIVLMLLAPMAFLIALKLKHISWELLGDGVLIACGFMFSFIFISILVTGGYMAVEKNSLALNLEVIYSIAILIIGVERLFDDIKKRKRKGDQSNATTE